MIIVVETWSLKPEYQQQAYQLMQQMDDMLGPAAHEHPGWCGHAHFYQNADKPTEIFMLYPWKNRELHLDLAQQEEGQLQDFYDTYCTGPRHILYYTELPVDVEHDEHV
jgi:hypothetical protein